MKIQSQAPLFALDMIHVLERKSFPLLVLSQPREASCSYFLLRKIVSLMEGSWVCWSTGIMSDSVNHNNAKYVNTYIHINNAHEL